MPLISGVEQQRNIRLHDKRAQTLVQYRTLIENPARDALGAKPESSRHTHKMPTVCISFSVPADSVSHKIEFDDGTAVEVVKEQVRNDLGISRETNITLLFEKAEISEGTLASCGLAAGGEEKESALYEVVIETEASSSDERQGSGLPTSIEVPARGPGGETAMVTLKIVSGKSASWEQGSRFLGRTLHRVRSPRSPSPSPALSATSINSRRGSPKALSWRLSQQEDGDYFPQREHADVEGEEGC